MNTMICAECGEGIATFPNEVCDDCLSGMDVIDTDEYYRKKQEEEDETEE